MPRAGTTSRAQGYIRARDYAPFHLTVVQPAGSALDGIGAYISRRRDGDQMRSRPKHWGRAGVSL
jgi:hypothetical protein